MVFRTTFSAASVMVLVDAIGIVWSGEAKAPVWTKLWLLLQACAFLSGFAIVAASGLALAIRGIQRSLQPSHALLAADGPFDPRDLLLSGFPAVAWWSAALYWAMLEAPKRFRNVELSAFLLVVAALVSAFALLSAAMAFATWFSRARRHSKALFATACAIPAVLAGSIAWGTILWDNRAGLLQLDRGLVASVLAAPLAYFASARFWAGRRPRESRGRRAAVALLPALLASVLGAFLPWRVVSLVARSHGVAGLLIAGLRSATDFDGDGYSSLFMGGDCAPFDERIHPGALEVPRDRIDNNCMGGDSEGIALSKSPPWHPTPGSVPDKPNVFLITIETLRADRVSFLGHHRPTTPKLKAYAQNSYVFERFFATTPWTRLSLASLFSSHPPTRVHWEYPAKRMPVVASDNPWLPHTFQKGGYDTIAVLPSFAAFTSKEAFGFERGFKVYDTSTKVRYRGGTLYGFPGRNQAKIVRRHLEQKRSRPFFLWVHLMEPHYAYERSDRAPDFGGSKQGLYESEIWEADAVVGTMLEDLKQLGLHEKTLVMVVGDHGEEFQEHGRPWHGSNLYQPQVHTAGLLHVPGLPGGRVSQAVSHEDVAPTLLNLSGIRQSFDTLRGRNLTALLAAKEPLDRSHFFLERYEMETGKKFMAAVVHYPHKLIYTEDGQLFELYDLRRDPDEKSPLSLSGETYGTLGNLLRAHVDGAQRSPRIPSKQSKVGLR